MRWERFCWFDLVPRAEGEFVFWALPGGEIEAGETEAEAAEREVREELGLELKVTGPIYRDSNQFLHQGEMQDNVDFLFRAECGPEEPRLIGVTADERKDHEGDSLVEQGGD
jgi:8-oxo-dGTP diphosphatase